MTDGLAGGLSGHAVVAVTPVYPIDIPDIAGQGRWGQKQGQKRQIDECDSVFHFYPFHVFSSPRFPRGTYEFFRSGFPPQPWV
jgi:hypothetical protein